MTLKEKAQHFLKLASGGDPRKAFELYVSKNFIHHNAYFKGDRQSLMLAMEEAHKLHPNKVFQMLHVIEDGDMVAVHSRVQQEGEGSWEGAVIHIFRFKDDLVEELWDFGQAVPQNMINENGMF